MFSGQKCQMSWSTIHMYGRWMFENVQITPWFYINFQSQNLKMSLPPPPHLWALKVWKNRKDVLILLWTYGKTPWFYFTFHSNFEMPLPPPSSMGAECLKVFKIIPWFYLILESQNLQISLPPPTHLWALNFWKNRKITLVLLCSFAIKDSAPIDEGWAVMTFGFDWKRK